MQVQPYLNFDGRCEQAIRYYQKALGAEITALMRFKDAPQADGQCTTPPDSAEKIMHTSFRIGNTTLMASDCHCQGKPNFQGISLSLTVGNVAEAERAFAALSDGGQVQMPLGTTFFSPRFGVVTDIFGVCWMIYTTP